MFGKSLLALHGGDCDAPCSVVVDHSVVLVPEDVLRGQQGILEDADEGYEGALLYPVLVRGEDDRLRGDHVQVDTPGLHLPIGQSHLPEVTYED